MRIITVLVIFVFTFFVNGYALQFPMISSQDSIIGQLQQTRVGWGDDFHSIGRKYDIGFDAMVAANPEYQSKDLPLFYHVLIPSEFILPNIKRKGIVINLADKRLFYYDKTTDKIMTFPIGIGKIDWGTPLGRMKIVQKIKDPTWYAPKSILKALAQEGYKNVPAVIPPGPQDPLGDYAMRLSRRMYLIHGTNDPNSIGTQASSGCIRLFAEDIDELFHSVPKDTQVTIVDDPYLLGWRQQKLFLAVYPALKNQTLPAALSKVQKSILKEIKGEPVIINWRTVAYTVLNKTGIPAQIGIMT